MYLYCHGLLSDESMVTLLPRDIITRKSMGSQVLDGIISTGLSAG